MNHRIKRVRVSRDGNVVGEHDLDPSSQELQTIRVAGPGGDYKIEVLATEPGSKVKWNEVCVSELVVLGTPPPGAVAQPVEVAIGSLDAKPVATRVLGLEPMTAFADIADVCKQAGLDATCAADSKGAEAPDIPSELPPNWDKAYWVRDSISAARCHLVVEASGQLFATAMGECKRDVALREPRGRSRHEVTRADVIPGGPPELVVVLRHKGSGSDGTAPNPGHETLQVCGTTRTGVPGCTAPLVVGAVDEHFESVDDGLDQWMESPWTLTWSFANGHLVLRKGHGKYDELEHEGEPPAALGRYVLRP